MKAGIYKRYMPGESRGKHIYVAKDRTIRAYEDLYNTAQRTIGTPTQVATRERETIVTWASFVSSHPHEALRVSDVPNGCTDPVGALQAYLDSRRTPRHCPEASLELVVEGTLRTIGKQSKRKHRKQGHRVWWHNELQSWVWSPSAEAMR